MFTWLFGNGWWMYAELHDYNYPNDPRLYTQHQSDAFRIMLSALCFLAVTYILRAIPITKQWFAVSPESLAVYDEAKFRPGDALGQVFPTWRSIENLHIFCWLGKDTGWSGACAPAMRTGHSHAHISAGTRPHLRRDSTHICAGTRPTSACLPVKRALRREPPDQHVQAT
jgi:hypothetical protein